jgi:acyl dehydratase
MNAMPRTLHTASRTVDFASILNYAEVTRDWNPIHVDPAFAARTPMGGVIAHGTLSLALIWQALRLTLGAQALDRVMLDIRFVRPVRVDDVVTGGGVQRAEAVDVWDVWVKNQKDENVIVGTATLRSVEQ